MSDTAPTEWPDLPVSDDEDETRAASEHHVPPDLIELYEVLEWDEATRGGGDS